MQSILTSLMSFSFSVVAASSYSGARALQWPHHGAKTVQVPQISICISQNTCGRCDVIHSARTMSLLLMYSSKSSFLSCVTSDADATAAAASSEKTAFLKEGIFVKVPGRREIVS